MKHDFVCVGFSKCATTTLDAIMRQHPDIALPCHKETLFFEDERYCKKGIKWYETRYYGRKLKKYEGKIVGEVNPRSALYGNVEKRILDTFGDNVKFIYMMRNPVDALFSFFKHVLIIGFAFRNIEDNLWAENRFDDFLDKFLNSTERDDYFQKGLICRYLYGRYFGTLLKYVPKENIHIVLFEDFIQNQEKEVKKIFDFIGANKDVDIEYNISENIGKRIPINKKSVIIAKTKTKLWENIYTTRFPYMGSFIERRMDMWYWDMFEKGSRKVDYDLKMSESARRKLEQYYIKDVQLLDDTLGTEYKKRWGM